MNFLNMFSDEAPISNSGYRSSLYTDPSIMQGIKFLNNEKDIANNLSENLILISQTNGSNLASGKVINGKIYEGMTTADADNEELYETRPSPPSCQDGWYYKPEHSDKCLQVCSENSQTRHPDGTCICNSNNGSSNQNCDPRFRCVSNKCRRMKPSLENEVAEQLKDKDIEYLEFSYYMIAGLYDQLLKNFGKDYDGGIESNPVTATGEVIPGKRQELFQAIKNIELAMNVVGVQVSEIVQKRTKINETKYYEVMNKMRDTKYKIIQANNKIIELTNLVDPVSAVANREETHILSKQRYYMYMVWFILAVVVIYIMVANMINPNSSFNVLVICIIILVCIFVFIMYDKITRSWYYDITNGIKNLHIPRLDNIINFDPLVSIKYTS